MNVDRWLAIAGLLLGIGGIVAAYVFYVKTIRTKLLAIAYTQPVSLLLPVDDVPASYRKKAEEPSRVFLLFWNRGTSPIEKSDFVEPIKVLPRDRILRIRAHEKDAAVAATIDETDMSIAIELLRPGEAIIFLVDAMDADYTPDIPVVMKSPEMSVFLRSAPTEQRNIFAGAAAIATYLSLAAIATWSLFAFGLVSPLPPAGSGPRLLLAFLMASCLGLTVWPARLVYKRVARSLYSTTPYVPYKFFSLQKTSGHIYRQWRWLREASSSLMFMG
jgi:hypothetical protein